jgi:hypothetical protein
VIVQSAFYLLKIWDPPVILPSLSSLSSHTLPLAFSSPASSSTAAASKEEKEKRVI